MKAAPTTPAARAVVEDDAGRLVCPTTREQWVPWIAASTTRNYLKDDPLLDWLNAHGVASGFARDDAEDGWDPRTDLAPLLFELGSRFESEVMHLIEQRLPVTRIATAKGDARSLEAAQATVEAMVRGDPVIAQVVLRNPETRTYGVADLLVRSDTINAIVPGSIPSVETEVGAPRIGATAWHYRVIDIKYKGLSVDRKTGAAQCSKLLAEMGQVWLYNAMLGRIQGYTPPAGYLLGRHAGDAAAERSCLARLARVDHVAEIDTTTKETLGCRVTAAVDWVRDVALAGAVWTVLPTPSRPELYPNLNSDSDGPWHGAKQVIGAALAELTILPATKPKHRRAAHAAGMLRWDDPRVTAASLGVWDKYAAKCDAILTANRDPSGVLHPDRVGDPVDRWRDPAVIELYVDFETITNVVDDFSSMPCPGDSTLIFQIGAGRWESGEWRFEQWTADRLDRAREAQIIEGFLAHIDRLCAKLQVGLDQVRLVHWAAAELNWFERGAASARKRHADRDWPALPWFDMLAGVIHRGPVAIRGQFDYGLKSIAKAMHVAGLIDTVWDDGPGDGMGALVGAIWCDREAARLGCAMTELDLMRGIAAYNETDCRAMAKILQWLRANR